MNRLLIVLLILAALVTPERAMARSEEASPLLVVPGSGGWTGTTNRGHPMSFTVASSGTQWNTFTLKTDFNATTCGVTGTLETTVPGPGNITSDHFNVSGGDFTASGQFTSSTAANGTYTFTNHPIVIPLPFPPFTCTYFFNQSGTWTAQGGPAPNPKLTVRSAGVRDGWIVESAETSNQGGGMNSVNPTFFLGDDANNKQYRSILHFNTSSLPDNAVITKVTLKIKRQALVGTDPFTTHNKIAVDIREGTFSNSIALQLTDFQAGSSKPAVGLIANNPQAGEWYSVNLNAMAYPYINLTGVTQFRLRFQVDDNNDLGADYLKFYSGDAATTAYRPILIIEYTVP